MQEPDTPGFRLRCLRDSSWVAARFCEGRGIGLPRLCACEGQAATTASEICIWEKAIEHKLYNMWM